MRALILAAALTVACTTFAGAAEVKKDTSKASVVAGKTMTDTDMDKVTAGYSPSTHGDSRSYHANVNWNAVEHGFRGINYHAACISGYSC